MRGGEKGEREEAEKGGENERRGERPRKRERKSEREGGREGVEGCGESEPSSVHTHHMQTGCSSNSGRLMAGSDWSRSSGPGIFWFSFLVSSPVSALISVLTPSTCLTPHFVLLNVHFNWRHAGMLKFEKHCSYRTPVHPRCSQNNLFLTFNGRVQFP